MVGTSSWPAGRISHIPRPTVTPEQQLCAAHADGLRVAISEIGRHPAAGMISSGRAGARCRGSRAGEDGVHAVPSGGP
jgi:hypothetical protein